MLVWVSCFQIGQSTAKVIHQSIHAKFCSWAKRIAQDWEADESSCSVKEASDDIIVMGLVHKECMHWGVQFHPESVGTKYGGQLLQNFRRATHQRLEMQDRTGKMSQSLCQACRLYDTTCIYIPWLGFPSPSQYCQHIWSQCSWKYHLLSIVMIHFECVADEEVYFSDPSHVCISLQAVWAIFIQLLFMHTSSNAQYIL